MQNSAMLDSFQLIIGIYLLIVAVRGSGQLYNFNLRDDKVVVIQRKLRIYYFILSFIALLDGGLNILQNTLFQRTILADGMIEIIRNPNLNAPDWITYPLISHTINALIALFLLLLLHIFLMLRKNKKQ